jgi:Tfp pilus assembly protein PilN
MIRINLLGIPRKTRGKRAAAVSAGGGEGSSTVIMGVVVLGALAVGIFMANLWVNKEHDSLEKDWQKAVVENQRLAEVKAKYDASKRKTDVYERRVRVIDELKALQAGPMDILNLVADTVNRTEAVWLETMTDDGKNLTFTGTALSPNAVADLMANLRKTGAFKTVEIKETAQDSQVKEVQAFKFELICEKAYTGKIQKQS